MSSWITNGLKTLRIRVNNAVGSVTQQRSPPHFGAQVKEIRIPEKPKKPLTPYFRFLGQVRGEVQKENPSLKTTELMKVVAQRWEHLGETQKQSYIVAYKNEMESYSKILEKYKKSLTPQQIQAQEQLKVDKQLMKEKRDRKKRLRELGKPKRPASAFLLYVSSQVPKGSGIEQYQTASKALSETWRTMSDAQKAPYVEKYNKEHQNYEKSLLQWEEKMLKQGHEDLVRESSRKPPKPRKAK